MLLGHQTWQTYREEFSSNTQLITRVADLTLLSHDSTFICEQPAIRQAGNPCVRVYLQRGCVDSSIYVILLLMYIWTDYWSKMNYAVSTLST